MKPKRKKGEARQAGTGQGWREAWKFHARERRALLYLLPALCLASWLVYEIARPRFNAPSVEYSAQANSGTGAAGGSDASRRQADSLFAFDPNTIEYHDLCRLGFTRGEALGIVKYRQRGKIFEIPEDFASCYQVSEEMYLKIRSFIVIGEPYRLRTDNRAAAPERRETVRKPGNASIPEPFSLDTITASGLQKLGFSARQAEVILNYRDMKGGLRSAEEFAECYVVSEAMFAMLAPYLVFPEKPAAPPVPVPVNLNTADSAELRSVRGIGEKTVATIMDYRRRLGGFHSTAQLAEAPGVTEQNYELIVKQIFVDSCGIQKIDINFASAKALGLHPYIQGKALRKLLKLRQLKGGWDNAGQLIEDDIFTPGEAEKLAPYLLFGKRGQ